MSELRSESSLRSTAYETAMQAAKNEGILEGASALQEYYELALEDAE